MLELGERAGTNKAFLDQHLLEGSQDLIPLFFDIANNFASDLVPPNFLFHQRKKFMHDVKKFFLDEPYFVVVLV